MNNDLISRSELKKALHNFFDGKVINKPTYILRDVFCYIDNAPTVEQKEFEQILQPIKVNIPEDIKDRLIEELSKPRKVIPDESKTVTDCMIAYGDGFESARRLYERPHGEWIFNNKWQDYECNKCHDWTRQRHGELPNFCGNCGADMRKGEKE